VADADRREHLTGEERRRQELGPAVRMMLREANAVVEDDLDAAVGHDRLWYPAAGTVEDPEALDDGGLGRRRRELRVPHAAQV
jgi:hypothetical protein